MSQALVDLLVKEKAMAEAQAARLREAQSGPSELLIPRCVSLKLIDDQKLLQFLAAKFNHISASLEAIEITPEATALLPIAEMNRLQVIPFQVTESSVRVALADPTFIPTIQEKITTAFNKKIDVVLISFSSLQSHLVSRGAPVLNAGAGVGSRTQASVSSSGSSASPASVPASKQAATTKRLETSIPDHGDAVPVLNTILSEALRLGASDIHIEPTKTAIRVRVRIDGTMADVKDLSLSLKETLVARTKILARLDPAERRIPQDGKLKAQLGQREYDFRVNVLPMIYGESVVLRVIKQDSINLTFSNLGFSAEQEKIVKKGIHAPFGMVLVTGPTGSGKTTTLYAALTELNDPTMKLATVEDPVEYNLDGIVQTQINKETGLGFAEVLRALLRQDPDVILVGEIRDNETAMVAVQAGLTGHVVLSTLHTNDAPSTILRLANMGVEPILVVGAVNVVVAQRLLRKLCEHCRSAQAIKPHEVASFGVAENKYQNAQVYHAKGCAECNQTGYKGRLAVYEVMDFTQDLKELVLKGENSIALRKAAILNGMETLPMAALAHAVAGRTSLEEAASCIS
jgi:type IV pilus assembly protein PilB